MYGCDSWTIKKAESQRIRTVVLEKTPERPLESKEMKPVNPNGNQPWIFIGRTDAEAPMLWPPDCAKTQLSGKDTGGWERLRGGGEGVNRGGDGWMASSTQCTRV